MEKLPEQVRYETLEAQYEATRLAVEDGALPVTELEEVAAQTSEAARVFAIRRGWVLPEITLLGQSEKSE